MGGIGRVAGALAVAVAGVLVMTGPAWSDPRRADEREAYTRKTCERILEHRPTGGVEKTTEPPAGSKVHPGDVIEVRLTWEKARWDGAELHKAIDCVSVQGVLDLRLTAEEKPTANDGVFEHRLTVPDGLAAGTEICDQGFISGDSSKGGFDQEISQILCFTVGPPREAAEETTTTTTTQPPSPPTTVTTLPPPVLGGQESPPPAGPALVESGAPAHAVAPAPKPAPAPVRPRAEVRQSEIATTGPAGQRHLVVTSGLALTFGGLSVMAGAWRSRRRSTPAETFRNVRNASPSDDTGRGGRAGML